MARYSLKDLGLLDPDPDSVMEIIADLVQDSIHAPIALVTFIDDENDRQIFKASRGVEGQLPGQNWTPLSYSLCDEVRWRNATLCIPDLSREPGFRNHPALRELGVHAYLGAPVLGISDDPIGAVCAVDGNPRVWSHRNRISIANLAALASQQVLLRAALSSLNLLR